MIPRNTKRQRFLWYGEESDVLQHAARFNAVWSAAVYNCKPGSETSENEEEEDVEDDDEGHKQPTLMDASTPYPRRSPRKPSPSHTDTVNEAYSRQARRWTQIQVSPTEASKAQLDGDDDADADADTDYVDDDEDDDFLVPSPPTLITSRRTRRARRLIPTSSTGTPIFHPSTATVNTLTRRKRRRLTRLPSTEANEAQLNADDDAVNAVFGDPSEAAWDGRFRELADYRKVEGHCNVPKRYSENKKLAKWVNTQRQQYKLHLEGKSSHMTTYRIQALENLGFEWNRSAAGRKGC